MASSTWQTLDNVFTVVRDISNKDTTTLPNTVLIPFANKYYYQIIRELVGLHENLYCEISSTDLVVNQREYMVPTDNISTGFGGGLIQILRVEVNYSGSDWKLAEHITLPEIKTPVIDDDDVDSYFSKSFPKYYFKDRSVWIIPTPDSSDSVAAANTGLYIYWVKRPNELVAATVPELPKDWLAILQEGILYEVFRKFGRVNESRDALQNWHVGISRMKELEQNLDPEQKYILRTIRKNYK